MDAISAITFNVAAPDASQDATATAKVSVFDIAHFEEIQQAQATPAPATATTNITGSTAPDGFRNALDLLQNLNGSSDAMGIEALRMAANRQNLTPGEMLQLTVHAHEFLFQTQLTTNIANRTSDGIQQLFRQQS